MQLLEPNSYRYGNCKAIFIELPVKYAIVTLMSAT